MSHLFDWETKWNEKFMEAHKDATYLVEQKKYREAIEGYNSSLKYLSNLCETQDLIEKAGIGLTSTFIKSLISNTISLADLTSRVSFCYVKLHAYEKSAYFSQKLETILKILDEHPPLKYSDNQYYARLYEQIAESAKVVQETARLGQAIQQSQENKPSLDDLESTFKELCAQLEKFSSYKSCLLFSPSIENSTSSNSSSCFIATAAYSTSAHPDLDTFRNFRDEKLLTHPLGKQLVSLYYRISPSIAQHVEKLPSLKHFLRRHLGRLAQWMRTQRVTSK